MTAIVILLVLIQSTLVTLCLLALKLAKLLQQINRNTQLINNEEIAEIKKNVRKIPIANSQVFKDSEIKR